MVMRRSRVLEKLRSGKVASCVKLNLLDPRVTEIAAMIGFDSVWIDMEHVPTDWGTVENQVRAAKIHDADVIVRVAKGSYSDYIRPLELDAAGIMIPHIMSYEEAKSIVKTTRFHPIGRRPLDGGNADGDYCMIDTVEYIKQANRERFICVQIEDPEPLADLEKIAGLEGIDIIFFGPGDFSQGIGSPGDWLNPRISDTRKRIAEVCQRHGKFAGTVGGSDNFKELIDMGYQYISVGADVVGIAEYFKSIVNLFN
ncbi:MAG: aldolase [Candidatus Latescibacteria bacterium]|nr:aldolase [Candidatus Latescibacterota bacterium]